MEPLNAEDADWLIRTHNRLVRMRKREAAHSNSTYVIDQLGDAIEITKEIHEWLKARLSR